MSNRAVVDAWVKDGTQAAEPVTVETPAAETTPAVVETPTPAPDPTPTDPAPTPEPVTMAQFIEARRGEEPYQLPEDVLLPVKRKGAVEYVPVAEVLKAEMMEKDYRIKTAEAAEARRIAAEERAQNEAEKVWLAEERDRLEGALRDQAAFDQYQEHLRLMQENPMYRQAFEDQRGKRQADAQLEVYKEADRVEAVQRGAQNVRAMIEDVATRFHGVNPERVAQRYGDYLRANREAVSLKPEAVRADLERLFSDEQAYIQQVRQPVSAEIEELKKQMAALTASVEQKNNQTTHAVNRAKAPVTAPAGSPPGPRSVAPPTPFHIRELAKKNSEWAARRD